MNPRPYLLINSIQHYEWGTRGEDAFIPPLLGLQPEPGRPYAELWIGAHPKAPSQVVMEAGPPRSLPDLIDSFPQIVLGERVQAAFSGAFPFLLKVLSVGEALSIQAHPNQEQARLLHRSQPDLYPDENHKPEIAIALDSLDSLAGFKSLPEIVAVLQRCPELAAFIGPETTARLSEASALPVEWQQEALKSFFSALMIGSTERKSDLAAALDRLRDRLTFEGSSEPEESLFLQLAEKYPGDAGLFSIFLLKMVHLNEGESMFTGAGIPHAYLKGNLVECMAASDNVVRAGLTPKHKDVRTLVEMIDYQAAPLVFSPAAAPQAEIIYPSPAAEFRLHRLALEPGGEKSVQTEAGPEVLLVTRGAVQVAWEAGSQVYRQGEAVLIPAALPAYRLHTAESAQLFRVVVPTPGKKQG